MGRSNIEITENVLPEITKKVGKIQLLKQAILKEHRVELVNTLIPEKVILLLKQNEIIGQDDVEKIEKKCKDLRRKGAETMLHILYNSRNWIFEQLITALQEAGYKELAQKLKGDLEKKKKEQAKIEESTEIKSGRLIVFLKQKTNTDLHSTKTIKQKSRLSAVEYEVLGDCYERLVNELDSGILKNYLFQNELINEDDQEKISKKEKELRREGAKELITIIYEYGANAFLKLLISLVKADCEELSLKQDSALKQKKLEKAKVGLEIDLNSDAFENCKVEQTEKLVPEVTKKRGRVPLLEYTVLREHRVKMVYLLDPEKVISHLQKNNVFDQDDVQKIERKCKDLKRKGAETMLDILYNSGSWAFKQLIDALVEADYQDMAHILTEDFEKKATDLYPLNTTRQRGRLSGIEFEVLRDNHARLVNELDSSVLKNHLFENHLIDEDDMERISKKEEELRKEGAEEMLTIIYETGSNTFPKLLKSLTEAGYGELSSKLDSDLKQKKKEIAKVRLKIDLNSVAFPNYPQNPRLTGNKVSNWYIVIMKWIICEEMEIWSVAMPKWFKTHEFTSQEELKMVAKYWLSKLEDVVNRGCFEIDLINVINNVIQMHVTCGIYLTPYLTVLNTLVSFADFLPICTITDANIVEFVQTTKAEKQKLLKQQRQVLEKLKYNLEVIFEGKQNFDVLPIDTERCQLSDYFNSVVDDVKKIWKKLPRPSIGIVESFSYKM